MKHLICLLLISITSFTVYAQKPFTFGPKVGIHFNTLETVGDNFELNQDDIVSAAAGAFVRFKIGRCYFQPEGYWTTKGADFVIQEFNKQDVYGSVRLSTFDVPLIIGLNVIRTKTDVFNFRVLGGPVISSIINEKVNDFKSVDDNDYHFNKSDVAFQLGAGIDIRSLTIDFRYETGLSDINESFNQRTKLYMLSIGFKIL